MPSAAVSGECAGPDNLVAVPFTADLVHDQIVLTTGQVDVGSLSCGEVSLAHARYGVLPPEPESHFVKQYWQKDPGPDARFSCLIPRGSCSSPGGMTYFLYDVRSQ